jgi:hypothetical protein
MMIRLFSMIIVNRRSNRRPETVDCHLGTVTVSEKLSPLVKIVKYFHSRA